MMDFEQYVTSQIPAAPQAEFDCLVMCSGGKDSTYLLHQLHHVYNRRVMALTIDTGFEAENFLDKVSVVAEKTGLSWIIIKPPKSTMAAFYRALIPNAPLLGNKTQQMNMLCDTCGYVMKGIAVRFAAQCGIPVVVSGLNKDQLGVFAQLTSETGSGWHLGCTISDTNRPTKPGKHLPTIARTPRYAT